MGHSSILQTKMRKHNRFIDALKYLEIVHSTEQFPFALSNALKELAIEIKRPNIGFKKLGKQKNYDRGWSFRNRIDLFLG